MTKHDKLHREYEAAQAMQDELTLLEQRLGYRFADPKNLITALTHQSISDENYEVFEFRGDKILSFILSEIIHRKYPEYDPQDRTEVIDAMVCNDFLRKKIANPIGLASFMKIEVTQNTDPKVIADCVEALICAIYDDGGVKEAAKFIDRHWTPHFEYKAVNEEPIMRLSQYFNDVGMAPHPKYSVYKRAGNKAECVLVIPPHNEHTNEIRVSAFQDNVKQGYLHPTKRRIIRNQMALEALGKLGIVPPATRRPESMTMTEKNQTRCGFVTVLGAPNAGKSTLMNALVGMKVTIVSPKVQTTRSVIRGIAMHHGAQIVFLDTPGLFKPKKRLERAMVDAAWRSDQDADMTLLLVDVSSKKAIAESKDIMQSHSLAGRKNVVLILNKIDKIRNDQLLALAQDLNKDFDFMATFMISALKDDGTKKLLDFLAEHMPEGPYHYPEDVASDLPMRLLAAEITREKLFHRLHDELPYGLTVETEQWEQFDNGSIKISQTIHVAKDSHKGMILGKGGKNIKKIGEMAREELSEMFGTDIHLKLFVRLSEKWADDSSHYEVWGLDPNA